MALLPFNVPRNAYNQRQRAAAAAHASRSQFDAGTSYFFRGKFAKRETSYAFEAVSAPVFASEIHDLASYNFSKARETRDLRRDRPEVAGLERGVGLHLWNKCANSSNLRVESINLVRHIVSRNRLTSFPREGVENSESDGLGHRVRLPPDQDSRSLRAPTRWWTRRRCSGISSLRVTSARSERTSGRPTQKVNATTARRLLGSLRSIG